VVHTGVVVHTVVVVVVQTVVVVVVHTVVVVVVVVVVQTVVVVHTGAGVVAQPLTTTKNNTQLFVKSKVRSNSHGITVYGTVQLGKPLSTAGFWT
jgi:hypothetical protein